MKRYVCTVAAGFVLALVGTATASASVELPLPGQSGTQIVDFGDQSVGEQKNDADVTQEQGNGNLNIAPAIGLFGDAETTNEQGNGNVAKSDVDQENDVDQSQESTQKQSLEQNGTSGHCCDGQSQAGEQTTYGGDQSVDKQKNDADVTQEQGNGNINVSPAIAILGDAETRNEQGNGNVAKSDVDQENDVDQSQSSTQKQELTQNGDGCCAPSEGYGTYEENGCCDGQSQTGEQKTSFGDQWVGEQKNDADVTQKQGNGNINISPAVSIFGDAKTTNKQGNGNYAESDIDQKNDVDQSQDSYQQQSLEQSGSGGRCCDGRSQSGEQRVYGGDQSVEKQKNDADVTQKQGNENLNIAPAIAVFGDAETRNYQGNGNVAKSDVDQKNDVDQSQSSTQKQHLGQDGGSCCESKGYGKHGYVKEECCESGSSQTGEQRISFGDQWVGEQKNDADVTQKQGNENESFAPAVAIGGKHETTCSSKCGYSGGHGGGASTTNAQGNGNYAESDVDQKNDVDQSQSATQKQDLTQEGGGCCKPSYDTCKHSSGCQPKKDYGRNHSPECSSTCEPTKEYTKDHGKEQCCERSQDGSQKTYFGDQSVDKQKNEADVTQKQGNENESFAPAIGLGKKHDSCGSKCGSTRYPTLDGARTWNAQGNGNVAKSDVDQKNDVDQSQTSYQRQTLVQKCTGLINR